MPSYSPPPHLLYSISTLPSTQATPMIAKHYRTDQKKDMLLPTVADEKVPLMDEEPEEEAHGRSAKGDFGKRLVVAIGLLFMGASTLRAYQRYGTHSNVHLQGPFPPPPPPHHPMPFPHHLPAPIECFALEANKLVNFTLSIRYPGQPVYLEPSMNGAEIKIESEQFPEEAHEHHHHHHHNSDVDRQQDASWRFSSSSPPPPRPPHRGPHGRRHSTAMVTVNRLAPKHKDVAMVVLAKDADEMHICSLDLPFGQTGLGLFHQVPPAHPHKPHHVAVQGDDGKVQPERHAPKPFDPVAVQIHFPPGEPFTVSSKHPHPPFPFHHGRPPFWHGRKGCGKGLKVALKKVWMRTWKAGQSRASPKSAALESQL